jgi:hypothetical protein
MTDVKWQDPPGPKGGPGANRYQEVADQLRTRPGEWALISGESGSTAANFGPTRRPVAFVGDFEFTARSRPDGKADIYARYTGEAS